MSEILLCEGNNLDILSKTALRVAVDGYGKTANLKVYQDVKKTCAM